MSPSLPSVLAPRAAKPIRSEATEEVVSCRGVVKRFYRYEHRTRSMREVFIRSVLRRPLHVKRAEFTLTGLDLTIRRGEAVAFIGRNGSGKSTALRLIAGIYEPSEGVVEIDGRMAAVIELGVGFHPELTGAENIGLYAAVMGLSRREIEERLGSVVEFADIGAFIDEPLKYYSSGMHARLAFAVATACVRPDILILDEVLSVGDQLFREKSLDFLRRFHREGGTLIAVSHELETVSELCERALWFDQGRVRMDGPVDLVVEAYCAES
jgi:lipopolysaccharide transport system ATP-binding protein